MNKEKKSKLWSIIGWIIKSITVICIALYLAGYMVISYDNGKHIRNIEETLEILENENDSLQLQIDSLSLRMDVILGIQSYIDRIAEGSRINPDSLLDLSIEYDIYLPFMMAQGQIESHYATKGLGKKYNNVFNIGIYDDVVQDSLYNFLDPNKSLRIYCKTIRNNYLGSYKTYKDLLQNYVNLQGYRYAQDSTYEKKLRKIITNIDNESFITSYKKYREIVG